MRGLRVEPGDHDCTPPILVGDVTKTFGESDGCRLRWVCGDCGSVWRGVREFRKGWPGTDRYEFGIDWRRATGSGWLWRRRERRRVEASLGEVEGPWR